MGRGGTLEQARKDVRELGKRTEWRVLEGLHRAGIIARHATKKEDEIDKWDLEITFREITVHVDVTISMGRFKEKKESDPCKKGYVIPVLVDADATIEELVDQTMRQVVCSLNGSLVLQLLQEDS